jgi:hypothetical protein
MHAHPTVSEAVMEAAEGVHDMTNTYLMPNQPLKPGPEKKPHRRRRPPQPRFQMRVSTKYAPHKPGDGKVLTCSSETTLKLESVAGALSLSEVNATGGRALW